MSFLSNLDLVAVALTAVAISALGFSIYHKDRKSYTNLAFFVFSVVTVFWSATNYMNSNVVDPAQAIWWFRTSIFFAVWHAFSFLSLFFVFPESKVKMPKLYPFVVGWTIVVSGLTLTPLVFEGIEQIAGSSRVQTVVNGPAVGVFALTVLAYVVWAIVILLKKYRSTQDRMKSALKVISFGTLVTFLSLLVFNLLLPTFFGLSDFIVFAPVFFLPFIGSVAYAIIRHGLFNIKIIFTQIFMFLLWCFVLIRTLLYRDLEDLVIGVGLLIVLFIAGVFLIKSVQKEVSQREQLEKISKDLQQANVKLHELDNMKTEFLSLASHQLRSPLTAIKGYSSMALEGTFGRPTKKMTDAFSKIFESSQRLTRIINDLLDVSKIEQGGLKYEMRTMSVSSLVQSVVDELQLAAKEKGLKLVFNAPASHKFAVKGDNLKLRQVIQNLVDNAIKYTEKGQIEVSVEFTNKKEKILLSITDTGMGISEETLGKLFQKFSRGEAGKSNTSGSGLGLYLAQQIVKAHAGRLWAESPGLGKGSTFFVELPTQYV